MPRWPTRSSRSRIRNACSRSGQSCMSSCRTASRRSSSLRSVPLSLRAVGRGAKRLRVLMKSLSLGFLLQTITERLVVRVDDLLKPDVIRWAAFYVRLLLPHFFPFEIPSTQASLLTISKCSLWRRAGTEDEGWKQEDLPPRGFVRLSRFLPVPTFI